MDEDVDIDKDMDEDSAGAAPISDGGKGSDEGLVERPSRHSSKSTGAADGSFDGSGEDKTSS
jgi:hypothetical protein